MTEGEKPKPVAPAKQSPRRQRTAGIIATLAGVAAGVVGLVGVLSDASDLLYVLLFAGGMLVSVLGLRRMRRVRESRP